MHPFRTADARRSASHLPMTVASTAVAGAIAIVAWLFIVAGAAPSAQQTPLHLNLKSSRRANPSSAPTRVTCRSRMPGR